MFRAMSMSWVDCSSMRMSEYSVLVTIGTSIFWVVHRWVSYFSSVK
jgi:uncharacterized membrane protein (DUF2068 family)